MKYLYITLTDDEKQEIKNAHIKGKNQGFYWYAHVCCMENKKLTTRLIRTDGFSKLSKYLRGQIKDNLPPFTIYHGISLMRLMATEQPVPKQNRFRVYYE